MTNGENIAGKRAVELRSPTGPDEWSRYFDLRWRVLRAPWSQPRGSERDDRESDSAHLAIWDGAGAPLAVGRVHLRSAGEAQVRYMAVEPGSEGLGLGSRILSGLEAAARDRGAQRIVLNARADARRFYESHGYTAFAPGETMFGEVQHVQMSKQLPLTVVNR